MSTFKDPFEEAFLKNQTVEAEAEAEELSLASPRRPHDAPPSIPSSAVQSPPYGAGGDGGDDDEKEEERTEVQRDDFPSSDDSDELARLRMIFKDPFEEAWLKDQAAEAEESLVGSQQRSHDAPPSIPSAVPPPTSAANRGGKDDDEEDERTEVKHEDFPSSNNSAEYYAWKQTILSSFTKEQMSRYESFRRSTIPKSEIKKILTRIIGVQQGNADISIVVSALAKMFVGDLVETVHKCDPDKKGSESAAMPTIAARVVMAERKDSGPIRPCHIRESYRRLKIRGKTFKRTVPRLFH